MIIVDNSNYYCVSHLAPGSNIEAPKGELFSPKGELFSLVVDNKSCVSHLAPGSKIEGKYLNDEYCH